MEQRHISVRSGLFSTILRSGGHGEPLLYLHGVLGLGDTETFLAELAQNFTIYAPSHPGFGTSTGLDHIDDIFDLVVYYNDFLDALELESVHVVGHSLGGMFAAEFAALCPQRVRKLILVSPLGLWDDRHPVVDFFALRSADYPAAFWSDPKCAAATAMHGIAADREGQLEAFLSRMQSLGSAGKFLWPIPDRGLKKRIHRITARTHIVWGADDRLTPVHYAQTFQQLIPGATTAILQKCGHLPMYEDCASFTGAVREFLHS
jgi:pimeloyl-ACP methyl ester carboxylesterase